jgi:hypothetical protein
MAQRVSRFRLLSIAVPIGADAWGDRAFEGARVHSGA